MMRPARPLALVLLALLFALIAAGCGAAQPTATQPSPSPAAPTAAGAAATATAAAPAAAAPTGTSATSTAEGAGASAAADATPAIVAAANAFLATLSDAERESVLFDWGDSAQKQRWSNLPEGLFEREGLRWGDMGAASQDAWLALMEALLSDEGYARILAEWYADDALAAASGGGGGGPGGGQLLYGRDYYWVALIGAPSETEPWQFQWGGHHVTVNATIVGSEVALVPSFIGCQPCSYTDEAGNSVRPLGDIEDAAFALVNTLDAGQQQAAVLGDSPIDLVLGPGEDGRTLAAEGLPAAEMSAEQRAALLQLISLYTGIVNEEDAAARLAEVEATLDETYFAWYGPTAAGSAAYFRVAGPTIVIEYSPQSMGGNAADHIHGIYRDPTNDYGAALTQ